MADAARRPGPPPRPRPLPLPPRPRRAGWRLVMSRPWADAASVAAKGCVGSSQWRWRPASRSPASRRSSCRNVTWLGRVPGSGRFWPARPAWPARRSAGRWPGAARRGTRPRSVGAWRLQLLRLGVQPRGQPGDQGAQRLRDPAQRACQPRGRVRQARRDRVQVAFQQRAPSGARRPRRACGPAPAGAPGEQRLRHVGLPGLQPPSSGTASDKRMDQPGAGRARAACRAASSGASSSARPPTNSSRRRRRPRARDAPPSAPSSQRRSSAPSMPLNTAANALSAASKTWCPRRTRSGWEPSSSVPTAPRGSRGRLHHHQRVVRHDEVGGRGRGGSCAPRSSAGSAGRRRGCTRPGGRPGRAAPRGRTARRTSPAGRRRRCRHRRSPAPSGRAGRAG